MILICLPSMATCTADSLQQGDEFWVVSTRGISSNIRSLNLENPNLSVKRYEPQIGYQHESISNLLSSIDCDQTKLNILYIHGNRFTRNDALKRAWTVYRRLGQYRRHNANVRWILWSWPSDPVFGPLKDVRMKAPKADSQTLYVGWFLQRFPPLDRLHMIGYSFGGRIVTGSLHTAAGGSIDGRSLPGSPVVGASVGISLVAPALDHNWLSSGAKHGRAVENLASLNLYYNNRDRVLKMYSFISKYYNPVALGSRGLSSIGQRSDGRDISIYSKNCSRAVGLLHDELKYYEPCCSAARKIAESIDTACENCIEEKSFDAAWEWSYAPELSHR